MRLNDRVAKVVEEHRDDQGRCNMAVARRALAETFDSNETHVAKLERADRLLKAYQGRAQRALYTRDGQQIELPFPLHPAYALEIDDHGVERCMKQTADLLRHEVRRVIHVRKVHRQHVDKSIGALVWAERAAAPVWDEHPDWTFGECLMEAVRRTATTRRAS